MSKSSYSSAQRSEIATLASQHGMISEPAGRDACGIGFVVDIAGRKSHSVVSDALTVLLRLTHRAAVGADPETGDGAGILFQIPDEFFQAITPELGIQLPAAGSYGVGMLFMPQQAESAAACKAACVHAAARSGFEVLGWRDVPVDASRCGNDARDVLPRVVQLFVRPSVELATDELERRLFILRRRMEHGARPHSGSGRESFYVASLSSKTIVYKGLLLPQQMIPFYSDLGDERVVSALALVHSRFSTNTFPTWERAHPYRYIIHNGEFNTVRGNYNWMRAREGSLVTDKFGVEPEELRPIIDPEGSDSAMFDNAVELLLQSGRSLPHVMMMLVPEAWQQHREMTPEKRGFYEYHSCMMEAWDGPAALAFTDGDVVGAMLDRNGLRPARYTVTRDGRVILASEVGCHDIAPENIAQKGRLEPGKMLLIDTKQGRLIDDSEIKHAIASQKPYEEWVYDGITDIEQILRQRGSLDDMTPMDERALAREQRLHGYTREDLQLTLRRMAVDGEEAIGSMGNDTPLAVLSERSQLLYTYFRQSFAQVTNPPVDPLRESMVMSLVTPLGREHDLFEETADHCRVLRLNQPVLTHEAMEAIETLSRPYMEVTRISTTYEVAGGGKALETALDRLCQQAQDAVEAGTSILVLSDREHDEKMAPIPALLACAAVHHALIRAGNRSKCGLIVESGEPRENMHFALLIGYGAAAVYPYIVWETLAEQSSSGELGHCDFHAAQAHFVKAVGKGLLKIMSKMGISTLQSYRGAQIFEAIGLSSAVIEKYFTWTHSKIEGVGLDEIALEVSTRHEQAYATPEELQQGLPHAGIFSWRRGGELHMYDPQSIGLLQHAARSGDYRVYKKFTARANATEERLYTLRGLLKFRPQQSISVDEVESVPDIIGRFRTGAMSFGSISKEAHENLAIAMNRIGGRSNTGEGGENVDRFSADENGDLRRSAIKQIASGRFGVTSNYLVNADELQIKMAQGAKPGEGGQLPGHKVDAGIAKVRHSTPGVGLISPPPHHDIYSIEDLAQLIFDLKNANEHAAISVKLVAEAGVGTVAAGVAKAKADSILISGDCGGTGASPLTSLKYAGAPWELGLSEAHQALVVNGLRDRVKLETDGHLKTGRDVAIACMLGAELFGFGTAALIVSGCVMMRACHLNTCPVGVATQDPELRKRFPGEPQHVINFMYFVAQELREVMAELGIRTVAELVGRVDLLEPAKDVAHLKAKGLDLAPLLHQPMPVTAAGFGQSTTQHHEIEHVLDRKLIELAKSAIESQKAVTIELPVANTDRSVGAMLSGEISRRYGEAGLPDDTVQIDLRGSAGQSFGAFTAKGVSLRLVGEANDYVGKGLSGGKIVVVPPASASYVAEDNVIVGNTVLYGATSGEAFFRGRAGERFAVRNSGATAVVEGVGDHGCEYMTGGTVVVIGRTGRNFGAGMSGGIAYVWDEMADFRRRCNQTMVHLEHLGPSDLEALGGLLERHVELTESGPASRVLRDWSRARSQFWKVISPEYKRVVQEHGRTSYEKAMARLATL